MSSSPCRHVTRQLRPNAVAPLAQGEQEKEREMRRNAAPPWHKVSELPSSQRVRMLYCKGLPPTHPWAFGKRALDSLELSLSLSPSLIVPSLSLYLSLSLSLTHSLTLSLSLSSLFLIFFFNPFSLLLLILLFIFCQSLCLCLSHSPSHYLNSSLSLFVCLSF